MTDNGPRYDWAARVAAQIVNLHLGSKAPEALVFGKILFLVLEGMYAAEDELGRQRLEPSDN